MDAATQTLIVDDHELVARGIERILSSCRDFQVVGVETDVSAAVEAARSSGAGLVLLDINIAGHCGLDLVDALRRLDPPPRVVLLSGYANPEFVLQAMLLDVEGYLEKSEPPEHMRDALRRIVAGEIVFSEAVARVARALGGEHVQARGRTELSRRERDALRLAAGGASINEVAEQLEIQPATVRTLLSRAHKKLGLQWNVLAGPSAAKLLGR